MDQDDNMHVWHFQVEHESSVKIDNSLAQVWKSHFHENPFQLESMFSCKGTSELNLLQKMSGNL